LQNAPRIASWQQVIVYALRLGFGNKMIVYALRLGLPLGAKDAWLSTRSKPKGIEVKHNSND